MLQNLTFPGMVLEFRPMKFINRSRELAQLNQKAESKQAELMVVYGRRRIGKTALLSHWLQSQKGVLQAYWVAHRTTSDRLLASFSQAISPLIHPEASAGLTFPDWESALEQLFRLARSQRLIMVIDEFPYLIQSCPELPSLLQKIWDREHQNSQVVLAICGSHYHMMVDQFFSSRQPLFGRATGSVLVDEIPAQELKGFLPKYSPDQIAQTAAVIGGVPHYLSLWNDSVPPLKNIEDLVLGAATLFRHEALFLIQEELPEPRTYLAILEALGGRHQAPVAISKATGIDRGHVGKYLNTLVKLRFIDRLLSADLKTRKNTRTSRYEIRDPYLRFYFEFIYPHPDWIEQRRIKPLREAIQSRFDAYVGKQVYEEWARARIRDLGDQEALPFVPDEVGRAWNPRVEIDVFAVNWKEKIALVGECKWQREKMNPKHLESLKERAAKLDRVEGFHFHYALFSKSGFTASLLNKEKYPDLLLFRGAQLEQT
jgi:uncharacterized protein